MKNLLKTNGLSIMAATLTWLAILLVSLNILLNSTASFAENFWLIMAAFGVFFGCFLALTSKQVTQKPLRLYVVLAVQLLAAFYAMWLFPFNFLAILTIIWLAALSDFTDLKTSFVMLFVAIGGFYLIFEYKWQQEYALVSTVLYGTFHMFAILMSHQTKQAQEAKKKLELLNAKLTASQQLIGEAAKQQERTRIARNLHDLLGHHLTALSINLQVASHITEGEAKAKVDTCHSIAKLLLSDVREAVSTLREQQAFDLQAMINSFKQQLPMLEINSQIDPAINIEDLPSLDSLLFAIQEAITNSLKHGKASQFTISISQDKQHYQVQLADNGQGCNTLNFGNGLKGMQERLAALGGTLSVSSKPNFALSLTIPKLINQPTTA